MAYTRGVPDEEAKVTDEHGNHQFVAKVLCEDVTADVAEAVRQRLVGHEVDVDVDGVYYLVSIEDISAVGGGK